MSVISGRLWIRYSKRSNDTWAVVVAILGQPHWCQPATSLITLPGKLGYSMKPSVAAHTSLLFLQFPSRTRTLPHPGNLHLWANSKTTGYIAIVSLTLLTPNPWTLKQTHNFGLYGCPMQEWAFAWDSMVCRWHTHIPPRKYFIIMGSYLFKCLLNGRTECYIMKLLRILLADLQNTILNKCFFKTSTIQLSPVIKCSSFFLIFYTV